MTARPVGGDTREALREEAISRLLFPPEPRKGLVSNRAIAASIVEDFLALDAVRDALDAQETVRRVTELADELGGEALMLPVMERAHASLRIYAALRGQA